MPNASPGWVSSWRQSDIGKYSFLGAHFRGEEWLARLGEMVAAQLAEPRLK